MIVLRHREIYDLMVYVNIIFFILNVFLNLSCSAISLCSSFCTLVAKQNRIEQPQSMFYGILPNTSSCDSAILLGQHFITKSY